MNLNRFLDVIVQDDTSVDYLKLTVKFCECDKPGGGCVKAPPGLAHWWPFDETTGTIAHDIAGARNGDTKPGAISSAGSPVSVPGKVVTAFEFGGSSAFVVVPDSGGTISLTSSFTIDAWINVKATDKSGIRPIVDKRLDQGGKVSGYAFFLLDGFLSFQLADGLVANNTCDPATSTTTSCTNYVSSVPFSDVADGTWKHVAAVVDKTVTPNKIALYVNGNVVLTDMARNNNPNSADLLIGSGYPIVASTPYFKGDIDELEIFNRALSEDEIKSIFKADKAGKCRGKICGVKFNDLNGNGKQDPGELGLPGWTIQVKDANGNVIASTVTDANGKYCIDVPVGTYTVVEVQQSGWVQTFPQAPGSYTVTVGPNQTVQDINFGNKKKEEGTAEICVLKFEDLNGNGKQDPGEPPLFGWKFDIKDNAGNLIGKVITDKEKPACLTVPAPGTYTITEQAQAGWTPTTPNPQTVTVQPGQTVNLSFGNKQEGKCDLVIGKSPARGTAIPLTTGQQVTFEIVVTNQGNGTCLAPLSVTDTFSAGLTYISGGTSGWVCPTTQIVGPSSVTCTNSLALAPTQGSLLLITFNVTAPPPTVIRNCAVVRNPNDSNDANNEACIEVPVVPKALCDLKMEKKVQPNPVQSGQQVTITLVLTNVGNGPCGPDTVVQDPKPTGLTFNPPVVVSPSAGWSCNFPGGNLSCVTASTLPAGYQATFTFTATVTALAGSSIQNCATVSNPNDTNTGNNQSCVTIQVGGKSPVCDLAISKEVKPNPLISGQPATYFITVINKGDGICNPTITVTDTLASGLSFISAGGLGVVCGAVGQTVTCTSNNPLNPGQSLQIQINVTVKIDPGKEVRNCATVKNPNDVNLTNNEACITTVVGKK
ncbi:DUF11 domain-containing protein [Candidatus Acetothermia bacterium]|nr:DUF11 domain-containing protein [Candidatus Acetothermia bacterium]